MIEIQMDFSGLTREEVLDPSALSFLQQYLRDEITSDDLIALGDYLEYPFDMVEVEKIKATRKKQQEYRLNHKAKKRVEKKIKKLDPENKLSGKALYQVICESLTKDLSDNKISKELYDKAIKFLTKPTGKNKQ